MQFDVAICVMLRHMLRNHVSEEYWRKVEANLHRMAPTVIILEPEGFDK
jgi:hypothetical protein